MSEQLESNKGPKPADIINSNVYHRKSLVGQLKDTGADIYNDLPFYSIYEENEPKTPE